MTYRYHDRYTEETKRQAIEDILLEGLLLEEVMSKYKILSKRTVIRWLKQHDQGKENETQNQT